MDLSNEVKKYMAQSVLCWLATASSEGVPNVSPKEVFTHHENSIIIANIASPQTLKNIKQNPNVCVSFIDILVQKGFQLKGMAQIVKSGDPDFKKMEVLLTNITKGKFPFSSITRIDVKNIKPILAPSYILFPETTEEEQIISAKKTYGLKT